MNLDSSHYSYATDPTSMNVWSGNVARYLVKLCKKINMGLVLYGTGVSGVTSIIAISQKLERYKNFEYGFILIRKKYDENHNYTEQESFFKGNRTANSIWIFVDDFIDTGGTFNNCISALKGDILKSNNGYYKFPTTKNGHLLYINQSSTRLVNSHLLFGDWSPSELMIFNLR